MKKILIIITVLTLFILAGCQEQRDAKIPIENPSYIVIYNAGTIIYEADSENGDITITADKLRTVNISVGDTSEYWLVYYITQNGKTTKIVDSDTLSIVWED